MLLVLLLCFLESRHAAAVDDPASLAGSFNTFMKIREKLPLTVRNQLWITDDAESAILTHCAKQRNVNQGLFSAYTTARAAEREIVKAEAQNAGSGEKAKEIVDVYKVVRKEAPWNFMKLRQKFKACFEKPSSGLKEYLALRKQEAAKDGGNLREINARVVEARKQDEEVGESEEGVKRSARSRDDEKEAAGTGKGAKVLTPPPAHATFTEIGEPYGSHDDLTSADVTNEETTTDTNVMGDNSILLTFAMVVGMVVHVVIAFLILVTQGDRIVTWCRRRHRNEDLSSRRETEPLHTGKQIPASGTTYSASKIRLNPA